MVLIMPPSLIMPPHVVNSGLWMRLCEGRLDKKLFSRRIFKISKLIDTKIILTSIQSKLVKKKFKWFQWRGFQKWWKLFVLLLVKNIKWHLVGQKWFKTQFEGYRKSVFKAFILFIWIIELVRHEKALPTNQMLH
jgi:hypothetical protein